MTVIISCKQPSVSSGGNLGGKATNSILMSSDISKVEASSKSSLFKLVQEREGPYSWKLSRNILLIQVSISAKLPTGTKNHWYAIGDARAFDTYLLHTEI